MPGSKQELYHLDLSRLLHVRLVRSVMKTGLPCKYGSESEWCRAHYVLLCVVILVSINVQRRHSS